MAKAIIFDEFHVTTYVRGRLSEREVRAARTILGGSPFLRKLLQSVQQLLARQPALRKLTVRISR